MEAILILVLMVEHKVAAPLHLLVIDLLRILLHLLHLRLLLHLLHLRHLLPILHFQHLLLLLHLQNLLLLLVLLQVVEHLGGVIKVEEIVKTANTLFLADQAKQVGQPDIKTRQGLQTLPDGTPTLDKIH